MKEIGIRPYGGVLEIHTTKSGYLARYNELSGSEGDVDSYNGICYQHDLGYVIGVFEGGIATLAHELVHLVFWEAVRTNFMASIDENDEPFAYLIGDLTKEALLLCPEILTQTL